MAEQRVPLCRRGAPPGYHMRATLTELGLSVADAAKRMGVSRTTLGAVLRGERPLRIEMALRFSMLTGAPSAPLIEMQVSRDKWRALERIAERPVRVFGRREAKR